MQKALAHGTDDVVATTESLEHSPTAAAMDFMYGVSIFLALVFIFCLFKRSWSTISKVTLFIVITVVVMFTTIGLLGTTIELNRVSPTGGPVHWHTDFQINVCGEHLTLTDPKGFSNKVGTPLLHEHNDGRMHIEGTPHSLDQLSLGSFFAAVGGEVASDHFSIPSAEQGVVAKANGDDCNGQPGTLYVFVEQQQDLTRVWSRLEDPASYIMSPHELIPPGDRVYITFQSEPVTLTDDIFKQLFKLR